LNKFKLASLLDGFDTIIGFHCKESVPGELC